MRRHRLHSLGLLLRGVCIGFAAIGLTVMTDRMLRSPTQLYTMANWHDISETYARATLINRFRLPEHSSWEDLEVFFTEGQRNQLHERTNRTLPANTPVALLLLTDGVMTLGEQLTIGPTTDWRPIIGELEKRMREGGLRDPYAQILFIDLFFTSFWEGRVSALFPRASQPTAPSEPPPRWRRT